MKEFKLYSQKAIAIATYIGGPVAAGILIRRNCINLGREQQGLFALITGIITTLLIFWGIYCVPEEIIDKVPNILIPAIYTGLIYLIVEKIMGTDIKLHKDLNGEFYSGWKAAGIGGISMVIIVAVIFGYAYATDISWDTDKYNAGLEKFNLNEEAALGMYDMIEILPAENIANLIDSTGIPKWQENIMLLDEMDRIENIPQEYIVQDSLLREYCKMRIEVYGLIKLSLLSDSSGYDAKINELHNMISETIDKLK